MRYPSRLIVAAVALILVAAWVNHPIDRVHASGLIQSAYSLIESAGTPQTQRATVNFTGTVSCSDSGGITVCNGAGGSPSTLALNIATKTSAYTFTSSDYAIVGDTTAGSFSVTLESAPITGQIHVLKKSVAANTLTLAGNGNAIDGASTQSITTLDESLTVHYDGAQWWIE